MMGKERFAASWVYVVYLPSLCLPAFPSPDPPLSHHFSLMCSFFSPHMLAGLKSQFMCCFLWSNGFPILPQRVGSHLITDSVLSPAGLRTHSASFCVCVCWRLSRLLCSAVGRLIIQFSLRSFPIFPSACNVSLVKLLWFNSNQKRRPLLCDQREELILFSLHPMDMPKPQDLLHVTQTAWRH